MNKSNRHLTTVLLALATSSFPLLGSTASCERVCLRGLAEQYLQALVARAPEHLPLADHVRYTENGQALELHDGLWGTASSLGKYRNVFEDPADGQVVVFAVLHENAALDLVGTRLRAEQGRITEIETIVSRPAAAFGTHGAEALEQAAEPDPLWSAEVPAGERMSKADLRKIANQYFSGMENNDGHGVYPFAADCYRLENGIRTTGNPELQLGASANAAGVNYASLGCKEQFQLGFLHVVSRIRDRRFLVADPEHGVVVAFGFFDHNAQLRSYPLTNGKTVPNGLQSPITWELVEAFRIEHGLIRRIEAVLTQSPYGMPPNWPTITACDRDCLKALADSYIEALVAHDPHRVPLAADIRIVENSRRIEPGQGLWKTASAGATDFRIVVPDPHSQEVGGMVMMQADGKPAQVGFRLKLVNGRIAEAEQMIAVPREASLANLQKLRPGILMDVPYEYRDSRGRLVHIARSYYDALDNNNGSLAPFAPDCERRENGFRTAPSGGVAGNPTIPGAPQRPPSLVGMQDCASQINSGTFQYITVIDDRRVEVADEQTGLALGFSHFHHAMTQKEFRILDDPGRDVMTMDYKPFDLPAMHIYKIWGGQIHEIEALGFTAPYNSPTGWE